MESNNQEEIEKKSPTGSEEDYNHHKENPAPAEEAVVEENEKGAGQAMKWVIPIAIFVLLIIYFLMKQ